MDSSRNSSKRRSIEQPQARSYVPIHPRTSSIQGPLVQYIQEPPTKVVKLTKHPVTIQSDMKDITRLDIESSSTSPSYIGDFDLDEEIDKVEREIAELRKTLLEKMSDLTRLQEAKKNQHYISNPKPKSSSSQKIPSTFIVVASKNGIPTCLRSVEDFSSHHLVTAEFVTLKEIHDTGFARHRDKLEAISKLRETKLQLWIDNGIDGLCSASGLEAMQAFLFINGRIEARQAELQSEAKSIEASEAKTQIPVSETPLNLYCELGGYLPKPENIDLKNPKMLKFQNRVINISQMFYDTILMTPQNSKFWNVAISELVTKILGDTNALKTYFLMSRSNRPTELFKAIQAVFAESCNIDVGSRPAFNAILVKRFPHYLQLHRRNQVNRQDRDSVQQRFQSDKGRYSTNDEDEDADVSPVEIKIEEEDY